MGKVTRLAIVVGAIVVSAPSLAGVLQGRVTDENGDGVAFVDLDFRRDADGVFVSCQNDDTDGAGFYSTTCPDDVYDVFYDAPASRRLAGERKNNVDLTEPATTIDVVLREAWIVTGRVLWADSGLPAADIDIDFRDTSSGSNIHIDNDSTDGNGEYSLKIPIGVYDVIFEEADFLPPFAAPQRLREISVEGTVDFALETVELLTAFRVTGELLDEDIFDAVAGADLDFIDLVTGDQIFTRRDNTDAFGLYDVLVPAGSYDLEFEPPPTSDLAGIIRQGVAISGDTDLGTDLVPLGVRVFGIVDDNDPINQREMRRVDPDFRNLALGRIVPTRGDDTDQSGEYVVFVESGSYDVVFTPKRNPQHDELVLPNESLTLEREINVSMPLHDEDGDGVGDRDDVCPFLVDAAQTDGDGDGHGDGCDNCPATFNDRQEDNDLDGLGDACDPDDDGDGVPDGSDSDLDGDGIANTADLCANAFDPNQHDTDADGQGDACDVDDGLIEWLWPAGERGLKFRPELNATYYDVYRNDLSLLSLVNYGRCEMLDLKKPLFVDPDVPEPGTGFFYLATGGPAPDQQGGIGRRSDGTPRPMLRTCFSPDAG